ncbi:MAG: carbamoyltransferase HypF [Gammaproteobacteria bacterium]|nr:carbamoyltransferase HypF [Gammaproteobacteria bacterium]MBU1647281.1 carbamoyltransferase HypF [Gammaproteobacteria bacterium]MBU1972793.1 carbamoyltransferase HypF [Gammaproteobacteria bacterium]
MSSAVRVRVSGIVQGVGFRPFVWRLAHDLGITGWVRNDAQGVEIAAEGERLEAFVERLRSEAPPRARVDAVTVVTVVAEGLSDFVISHTESAGQAATAIGPDTAICGDCLGDMFEPKNRRWRYGFTNCTNCGPRYTITRHLPYDRPQTSMAGFAMCPACRAEYDSPADRRFHAQPTACPVCGPQLALTDAAGRAIAGDAIAETLRLLQAGKVVAIKGLGGYHLACDATNAAAVATLRSRKQREEKPFAVMLANVASAAQYTIVPPAASGESGFANGNVDCRRRVVGGSETALLESAERPVVLLRKDAACDALLAGVAPGLAWLGVMLPYTPLQWLLFHEAAGRPEGSEWMAQPQPLALVMTSANPGGEPIVRDDSENGEALRRLAGIADAFLTHDRAIVTRCDDSVLRLAGTAPQFIRRSRGYTPQAIKLPRPGPPVLAVGGFLKNTICLTRGDEAFVSQHIGDLDNAPTCAMLEETVTRLMDLLEIEPEIVAHDLHPDFFSTRFAASFAAERNLPLIGVQHHHAHIAAVAAEHGIDGPLLGLALDGVGLGSDGGSDEPPRSLRSLPPQGADAALGRPGSGIWGGELLRVEGAKFERLGHLRQIALPGGDRAAREPWRMAAAALHLLGRTAEIEARFGNKNSALALRQMLDRGVNCPPTSSCGRWFDAAAGLLGVRDVAAFEGQTAMLLEGLAEAHGDVIPLADGFTIDPAGVLDLTPLLSRLADEKDAGLGAALFHATLAQALAQWTLRAAQATEIAGVERIARVALGGGCFLNRVLATALREELEAAGMQVLEARLAPPNDGGISLGQAWVTIAGGDKHERQGRR